MACASQHPGAHAASPLSGERLVGTASFALPPRYTSLRTSMTGLQVQLKDKWTFIRQQRLSRTLMSSTLLRDAPTFERTSLEIKYSQPPQHFSPPEKIEVFNHLQDWAEANILPFLKPVEECWQPNDYLPDPNSQNFVDEVRELREQCQDLPDDYLVCLVGDMVTEEALPTYQTMLNTMDGIRDETGASLTSWARWNRAWTAEENRHGDLLNKYLYLSGRVDMRRVEQTIQYLIGSGMDPQTDNSAYLGIIYTSFQERATFVSHKNTARQALLYGDKKLAQICGKIAGDERRHERAYTKVVEKLFEVDPDYTMLCLEDMMRKKITMPAHLMFDGVDRNIYEKYALVAQRTGVYTARDYADILEHLLKRWNVQKLVGLSSRGQQAQDYVCSLPSRVRKLDERAQSRMKKGARMGTFSWIFDRKVAML